MKINTDIGHTIGLTPLVQLKNIATLNYTKAWGTSSVCVTRASLADSP